MTIFIWSLKSAFTKLKFSEILSMVRLDVKLLNFRKFQKLI